MDISVKELYKYHMTWRMVKFIIPTGVNKVISLKDHRNLESWVTSGLVPSKQGVLTKTSEGRRGGMRKFSIMSAIAIETLWELVRFGFKPIYCNDIIQQMLSMGDTAAAENSLSNIDPIFIYHDHSGFRRGAQISVSASMEDIASWILNPNKDGNLKNKISAHIRVPVFMVLDSQQILEMIISRYMLLKKHDFDIHSAIDEIEAKNKKKIDP